VTRPANWQAAAGIKFIKDLSLNLRKKKICEGELIEKKILTKCPKLLDHPIIVGSISTS